MSEDKDRDDTFDEEAFWQEMERPYTHRPEDAAQKSSLDQLMDRLGVDGYLNKGSWNCKRVFTRETDKYQLDILATEDHQAREYLIRGLISVKGTETTLPLEPQAYTEYTTYLYMLKATLQIYEKGFEET